MLFNPRGHQVKPGGVVQRLQALAPVNAIQAYQQRTFLAPVAQCLANTAVTRLFKGCAQPQLDAFAGEVAKQFCGNLVQR